jgi:hypothetical protein
MEECQLRARFQDGAVRGLEPCTGKLVRTVLRGERVSNDSALPDNNEVVYAGISLPPRKAKGEFCCRINKENDKFLNL